MQSAERGIRMTQRSAAFFVVLALGAVLIITGLIYGLGSRQVNYKSVGQGSIAHYLSSEGTGYLQMSGSSSLYVVHEDNFTPKLSSFADGDTISFVYDPSDTTPVDVTSTLNTHLLGTASKVVEITSTDTGGGQKTYATPEYTQHPQGYNMNRWLVGAGLLVVGLLMAIGSFFLPRKKAQAGFSITPAPLAGVPMGTQPPVVPYQGPQQYPQPPNAPNYPPQPEQYQQPSPTSYGQPPQYSGYPQQQQSGQYEPTPYANPYSQNPEQ